MMIDDYERRLEARIDRELRALGELRAPATLATRVMQSLERRAALPWYRRSWQTWPAGLQSASLAALLAMFGALCFSAWELTRGAAAPPRGFSPGGFANLDILWRTLGALGDAVRLAVEQLGPGLIMGGAAVLLAAYAVCVGLGTVYLRVALARK